MRISFLIGLLLLSGTALAAPKTTMIGEMGEYETAREDDTLIEIAYREGVGYVELRAANPQLDPWLPGAGKTVVLPKQHLLPDGVRSGILVNLGEMRLYYYPKDGGAPQTYALGIGREGLNTPRGTTEIVRKTVDPTWTPTPRMRREKPELPAVVPPGPDNPMGPRAMYLGWPQYAIHGTNRPWGIGRRVSSGCLRMYNQDLKKLYTQAGVGTKVTVIDQAVKSGWIDGVFYIEAHPNAQQADQIERKGGVPDYDVSEAELAAVMKKAGENADVVDWGKVRKALRYRAGYPIAVSRKVNTDEAEETVIAKKETPEKAETKASFKETVKKTAKSDKKAPLKKEAKAEPKKADPKKEEIAVPDEKHQFSGNS